YFMARAALNGLSEDFAPSRGAVRSRQAKALAILHDLAARHGADFVDPTGYFCDAVRCRVEKDGIPLYRDADHLTRNAAEDLGTLFDRVLGGWISRTATSGPAAPI